MILYELYDGGYIGFYQEYGGTVSITSYRDVTSKEWIIKPREVLVKQPDRYEDVDVWIHAETVEEWVLVPEHVEIETRQVEGGWTYSQIWVEGHWAQRRYWIEEVCSYEPKTVSMLVLGVMRDVTRNVLVCEPAHWGVRQEWIAGWWKEVSEWEDEHEEQYEVMVRKHYEKQDVTYPGYYVTESVLVPGEYVTEMVESGDWEEFVTKEAIYSYDGQHDDFKLLGQTTGEEVPGGGLKNLDTLQCKVTDTGADVVFYVNFISCAKRIGLNEYIA